MRQQRIYVNGVSRVNRHELIERVREAVVSNGGSILMHQLFSNISISLICELPRSRFGDFTMAVEAAGVVLSEESHRAQEQALGESAFEAVPLPEDHDLEVAINLTFVHQEPDLRRDVPAIPG